MMIQSTAVEMVMLAQLRGWWRGNGSGGVSPPNAAECCWQKSCAEGLSAWTVRGKIGAVRLIVMK